jgi:hypothetical protein
VPSVSVLLDVLDLFQEFIHAMPERVNGMEKGVLRWSKEREREG